MVVVMNKATGSSSTVAGNIIVLSSPSVVRLSLSPRAIADYQKVGDDLVIRLHNGETIRIVHFYAHYPNGDDNDLVLQDEDGKLWVGQHGDGLADFNFTEIQSVDQLMGGATGGVSPVLLGLLGLGAVGGIVAAASGSDGDDDNDNGAGVDRDPPAAPAAALQNDTGVPNDGITGDGTVVVSNLEEGAIWQYSIDGGKTWHDGNGASFELQPGAYGAGDILVRQIDSAGNVGPATSLGPVNVDTTPPTTTVAITDPEGDNIPTASGTTEPGSTVVVTWPDGTTSEIVADGTTGNWTATAPGAQPNGDVTVAVTDPAGNPGTGSGTWTSSDTTPPDTSATTVTVGAIAGDGVVNAAEASGNVPVTVTIANPPSDAATTTVNVVVDGVPYAAVDNGDGTWTAQVPGSALAGAATPTVTAEVVFADAAGNDAAPVTDTQTYTVDVTPPTTTVAITDPEGDNIPTASGTTEPGSTVVVTWPDGTTSEVVADGATGNWTATAPGAQPNGDVTVAVTDPAGNPGTGSGTWTSSDTTPPDTSATTVTVGAIAGDGVVNAAEASGNVPVTVTIANPPSDAATTTVNVVVDGVPYAAVDNGDGTWTAQVPGSALAGAATPTVTAEVVFADAAGNDAAPVTDTQTYTVDTTPPTTTVAITDPEGDNIPTASGTTEPGSTVVVTWPDGTTSEVVADGTTGNWTATAPGAQPNGDVTVAVTDPAGNPGTGSGTWTSSDTTPPDTSATTVTVGAIAGDGVVNAAEASGNVPVTVTIANPPSDAATTTVNVVVDGVPYAAVDNGDGTWTAQVPGSALAGAATPTVTAEVVFADAAGNDAAPVTDTQTYTVDTTPPTTTVAITDPEGDNIPTASGTTEPGSTVVVTWPDGTTSEVVADGATGNWTATAPGAQPNGDVTVAVTDPAGNPGTGSGTWTTDTAPPDTSATTVTVGAIAGDGVVNAVEASGNVPVTVTITNPPSDAATTTVNVVVDGVPYAAVDNGDGTWTAQVPGSALAGAATPTVTAEVVFADAAGNDAAPVTDTQTYTVDTTPPTTTVAITDPEGDNIPTASGTTEPGSTVVVTWPDGTTSEVVADGTTGNWTATAPGAQPNGDVTVAVTDPAGNPGTGSGTWTTDTAPPDTSATTVTVGAIAGDGVVNAVEASGNVPVTVTITNPPSDAATTTVNVVVDGVPYAAVDNGDGTWTAQVPGSALAGAATPTVTAEVVFADAAGNDAAPVTDTQTYTVDTTPPTTTVAITDPEGDNIPTASGTTEPGSTVVVTWPDGTTSEIVADGTTGNWTATAPGAQPNGDVTVAVTDPAGNPGTGSGTWTSSDTTPPDTSATTVTVGAIAGDGVVNAAEASGNVPVTVTIANPPSDAATTTVNVVVDGVPYAAVDNGDGTWTAQVPGSALAGAATPTVTAEVVFADAAGNDAAPVTDTQTYTVDTTPPTTTVAITDPEGDNIPTASGTTEPGSTVVVTWPDGTTSEVVADGTTGNWTATAPGAQPNGDVTVAVTDPAGNPGTGSGTWTSDTTPPDTSATTVTVGAIAGDGVVNAAEASGNVPVTVTITNPPSDAATTTVNVVVDGVPYAAVDNGDGTWTAQVPGSALAGAATPTVTAEVVFADAAGNDAAPVTDTQTYTVDTTPPTTTVAITDPEGDNIPTASGTTEPGSTVVVTWPDGTTSEIVADGTTGNWTATAVLAQPAGTVSVAVTDPAGNPGSGSGGWTPNTTTPGAADDLATASVDVVPTETAVDNGSTTYLLGIGIGLGLIDLQATVLGVPSVGFTIADGHTQDLAFAFGGLADVGVLGDYQVVVQKWDALTGKWTNIDGSATGGSILNIGLLDGGANGVVIPDMDAGQYRAFMVYNGVGLSVLTTMTVSGLDHDYINTSIVTGEASGNVLDNDGGAAAAGHIVTSVNFNGTDYPVAAGPAGTTIIGQYGQLAIHQDGSYTYTPNADGTAIGKVDHFVYTLHDPVANTDTQANLYVRIDSEGQGLVWSETDPAADATYSVAATNDAAEIDITWVNPTDTAYFDQSQSLTGPLVFGSTEANSNQFVIDANMAVSGTVTVAATLAVLSNGTVTLQEFVGGVWQDVPNSQVAFPILAGVLGTVATIDLGSLGLDAGIYRVHTTLSGAASIVSITTDVNVTHLDQHVISGDPSISGSLVANDGVVPEGSRLEVSSGGTFVDATITGTVIHGLHGDLTVYSNGTYKYEPLDTLAYADREATDTFTYKIVLPGGYETTAELVVQLHDGAAVTFTTASAEPVLAESFSADTSGDVVALDGLAGSDASVSSPEPAQQNLSEALLLDDGGGEIVLPSSDSEAGGGSSADTAVSSTGADLITVDDSSAVTDPLAYLTPDPLAQEDPLHSAHMV